MSVRDRTPHVPRLTRCPLHACCRPPPRTLQSFSYMCTDVSVSRLLGELQRLTSLQQLDVLSPFTGAGGQGLVVWARELMQ